MNENEIPSTVSLRDYFAAAALSGYLAKHAGEYVDAFHAACKAYTYADQMMVVRKKNG